MGDACSNGTLADTGWLEVPPPPGGDGYACRSDINGDRNVDGADLGSCPWVLGPGRQLRSSTNLPVL